MAKKEPAPERKVCVIIRSADKRKPVVLDTWRYWEIVGELRWMGTDRQMAYDAAKWLQQLHPGDSQTLSNGIAIKITSEG